VFYLTVSCGSLTQHKDIFDMTILIKSPNVSTASGLQKFRLDAVLYGDNGGTKFLFDFPSSVGWPTQDAPTMGDAVKNLATTNSVMELGDGVFNSSGQVVTFAGGGVDFTGLTNDGVELIGPAGSLTSINDAANDYFLMCCYMKLPSSGDWNNTTTIAPLFACTTTELGWTAPEADLLTVAMAGSGGSSLTMRRQTAGTTAVNLSITALENLYGQVCQIAAWRNAAGVGLRIKSALGEQLANTVVGSNNSENFSAKQPRWGVPVSFNGLATGSGTTTAHRATHKTRLYRGWIEDLSQSGRNPVSVLDADWARVQARKTASGNSIFI
jgi:hypothetical protein